MSHAQTNRRDARRAVLIAGPTASGKSGLALALAEELGGVVVNADSMQVYRDLRILTARPGPEEEARIPHRLYGHVDAAENYSVGQWLRDVAPVLAEAAQTGRLPIIVGGTGLYFQGPDPGPSEGAQYGGGRHFRRDRVPCVLCVAPAVLAVVGDER